MNAWIAGKLINPETGSWDFHGSFSTEEKAIENCVDSNFFYFESTMDVFILDEEWNLKVTFPKGGRC